MIYKEIQRKLLYMLPERWESIYLYASVVQHAKLETGEMFFYYIPKGVIKKKPVNVYEIPAKFNLEEENYLKLCDGLYSRIKDLRNEMINQGEKPWSNLTISIEKTKFKVEFRYENLSNSKFTSSDRHLVWQYEYLNRPLNSYNKKERETIKSYLTQRNMLDSEANTYTENLYLEKDVRSIIYFDRKEESKEEAIELFDEMEINKTIEEDKPKNSILSNSIENNKNDYICEVNNELYNPNETKPHIKHKTVTMIKDIKPKEKEENKTKSQILNY